MDETRVQQVDLGCVSIGNVVWLDKASAARAVLGKSKPIIGLPFIKKDITDGNLEEVVLVEEEEGEADEEDMPEEPPVEVVTLVTEVQSIEDKVNVVEEPQDDAIPATDIQAPIPPGHWRQGEPFAKSKCILMRFSMRTDRKPKQAEKMSEYYKKYGNPNYGGMRGIISNSRKRRHRSDKMRDFEDEIVEISNKNPWGSLAQTWGTGDRSQTRPGFYDQDDPLALEKAMELRAILRSKRSNPPPPPPTLHSSASDSEQTSEESEDDSKWKKRLKGPLMRMYADDEEVKIEKRKILTAKLRRRTSPPSIVRDDLRAKLNRGSVWARLEAVRTSREKQVVTSSESYQSSDEEDLADEDEVGDTESEEEDVIKIRSQVGAKFGGDLRDSLSSKKGLPVDLRSKLNSRKTAKERSPPTPVTPPYEKSPLRIEISNDEYCAHSSGEEV